MLDDKKFDDVELILVSYTTDTFDEAAWKESWIKEGLGEYFDKTYGSNMLMNPQLQLNTPPKDHPEGNPFMIFLMRPATVREKIKHTIDDVLRDYFFELNDEETRRQIVVKLRERLSGITGNDNITVTVTQGETEYSLAGTVFYRNGEDIIETKFTISPEKY